MSRNPNWEVRTIDIHMVQLTDMEWADVYIGFSPPTCGGLELVSWVHSLAAGVDAFLFEKAFPANTRLTRTVGRFGDKIGEFCLSRVLADLQSLRQLESQQKQGIWDRPSRKNLYDLRVMILGTGEIGSVCAEKFSALGSQVYGYNKHGKQKPGFSKVVSMGELQDSLPEMEVVISTLPLTKETYHWVDDKIFQYCQGTIFLNVGRGAVLLEQALIDAIAKGQVRSAWLDVFEAEPLPSNHPFWNNPNINISPHLAGITEVDDAITSLAVLFNNEVGEVSQTSIVDPSRGY